MPFWPEPTSTLGSTNITIVNGTSPGLTPGLSLLAADRRGASSRSVGSRCRCHSRGNEASLSGELPTPRLPLAQVTVGDSWQNRRLRLVGEHTSKVTDQDTVNVSHQRLVRPWPHSCFSHSSGMSSG